MRGSRLFYLFMSQHHLSTVNQVITAKAEALIKENELMANVTSIEPDQYSLF